MITIVAYRRDRLAARLKNLLLAWDLANRVNGRLIVVWTPSCVVEGDNYRLNAIFDVDAFRSNGINIEVEERDLDIVLRENSYKPGDLISNHTSSLLDSFIEQNEGKTIFFKATSPLTFLSNKDGDRSNRKKQYADLQSRILTLFSKLPRTPILSECLRSLEEAVGSKDATVVHIRRGDVITTLENTRRYLEDSRTPSADQAVAHFIGTYSPETTYKLAIEQVSPSGTLLFFSDNGDIRNRFLREFAHRSFDWSNVANSYELTFLQRAFLEFSLMATQRTFIGSRSAFLTFAAYLSRGKWHDVRSYLTAQDILADIDNLQLGKQDVSPDEIKKWLYGKYATLFSKMKKPLEADCMVKALERIAV